MQKRRLGKSSLEVAPLALGGNVFGWTADETTSFEVLDGFIAAGLNLVDTADIYSRWVPGHKGGESETILGKWLKQSGRRKDVVIATKVGGEMGADKKGLKRAYILQAAEASLKRLQTDYIDLYQSHYEDPDTPIDETLEAYSTLIQQGKVRAIGASNYSAASLRKALKVAREKGLPRYESLQPFYNLYDREPYEAELEAVCVQEGLGVIPYFSLARGFLSGKYRSEKDLAKSPRGGGVKAYLNERGIRILTALDEVAEQYNSKPATVALAWLIARPSITAPIASATSREQLDDLVAATRVQLDATAIEKLDRASEWRDRPSRVA